jgi:hypothetical protein
VSVIAPFQALNVARDAPQTDNWCISIILADVCKVQTFAHKKGGLILHLIENIYDVYLSVNKFLLLKSVEFWTIGFALRFLLHVFSSI